MRQGHRIPALALDVHLKSSLAAIRSLGRQGVPIIAGADHRAAMGLYSRYVGSRFIYPSPLHDRRGFIDAVIEQSNRAGATVVLAFGDSTLLPLLHSGNFLNKQGICVPRSDREPFDIAFDKARTLKLALKIGLETPRTYFCTNESDLAAIIPELTYPVVIKPRRSVSWNGNTGIHNATGFAFSGEDVKRLYAAMVSRTREFPLIQEYIRGEETGVEFLCDNGRVLAASAHRRIRSVPPAGGSGVVTQTIPLSYNGLGQRAERLVAALRWSGPIMVEFKTDRYTGVPTLMETNGRFWGSLPLAIAAGVDFPYLYYRFACGEQIAPNTRYREGMTSRHLLGDLRNLVWVLFQNDPMRALTFPGRLRAIKDFLVLPRSCKSDVLDFRDLRPAAMEIFDAVTRRISRDQGVTGIPAPANMKAKVKSASESGTTL